MKHTFRKLLAMIPALFAFLLVVAQETIELKLPESNKVVIKLMFRGGSITDPAGKDGLANLTAGIMMDGGTKDKTAKQIQELIYPMAVNYEVSVDKEVTVFTFQVHVDFLDEFYPVLRDLMLHPSFSDEDYRKVKSNYEVYVDQVIRASSDEEYSKMALEDQLFRGTNYQHMVGGNTPGLAAITLDDVKEYHKNYFTRKNLTIGIGGKYPAAFLAKLKADMNSLPATGPELPVAGKANTPDGLNVEIISKDNALGSAVFTGFPLPITRSNDDFAALMVANSYLGEHRKSYGKLYDKIRSTRSMNYGDYSYIEWYENGGGNMLPVPGVPRSSNYFALWIRPVQVAEGLKKQYAELKDIETGHAQFALRLAVREIDEMIEKGISKEDFELTRQFLRSYNKLYIQTPEKQLGFLMDSKFYGRTNYIQEMDKLLAKLTIEDVNKTIRKYWQTKNMFITIVTDDSEAEPLKAALLQNKPSPMSYSNLVKAGLPKDVVDEDAKIANYKLNVKAVNIVNSKDTFKPAPKGF
ncbi:MAG TPA: pitrilysin family protein [Chitinophagaceae bacterium]|nr:pitrilysin family protein [Chitinophagaceae bacterium]